MTIIDPQNFGQKAKTNYQVTLTSHQSTFRVVLRVMTFLQQCIFIEKLSACLILLKYIDQHHPTKTSTVASRYRLFIRAEKTSMADADSLHEANDSDLEQGPSDGEADVEDDETSAQR